MAASLSTERLSTVFSPLHSLHLGSEHVNVIIWQVDISRVANTVLCVLTRCLPKRALLILSRGKGKDHKVTVVVFYRESRIKITRAISQLLQCVRVLFVPRDKSIVLAELIKSMCLGTSWDCLQIHLSLWWKKTDDEEHFRFCRSR
ncbi:uncharacterized protein LOC124685310 [Lolium rigidum]|uniref:uncharacterized protein LOC124685310 n=1 Tax=Lolium rigidum TaxID=89674 RepID=UPI001F5C8D52|nr:uncharacterized protein LOC124685310 [Lolium rigidum]